MRPALPPDDLAQVVHHCADVWRQLKGSRGVITGASGLIGSWLIEAMLQANRSVGADLQLILISRDLTRARASTPHLFNLPECVWVEGDVCSADTWTRAAQALPAGGWDWCIHAATDVGDPAKSADPVALFDTCFNGTRLATEHSARVGARQLLLLSSGAVYGPQPDHLIGLPETYIGAPDTLSIKTAYGQGKRAAEWLSVALGEPHGLAVKVARIFALLGPNSPLNGPFAAGNFIRDALQERAINIQGDGRPLRSYLYLADACVWLLHILTQGQHARAYNVGSEQACSIRELAEAVVLASGHTLPVHVQSAMDVSTPAPRYIPDTRRAQQELSLREWTGLASALAKTFTWQREAMTR